MANPETSSFAPPPESSMESDASKTPERGNETPNEIGEPPDAPSPEDAKIAMIEDLKDDVDGMEANADVLSDQMAEVDAQIVEVREELGLPPLETPMHSATEISAAQVKKNLSERIEELEKMESELLGAPEQGQEAGADADGEREPEKAEKEKTKEQREEETEKWIADQVLKMQKYFGPLFSGAKNGKTADRLMVIKLAHAIRKAAEGYNETGEGIEDSAFRVTIETKSIDLPDGGAESHISGINIETGAHIAEKIKQDKLANAEDQAKIKEEEQKGNVTTDKA